MGGGTELIFVEDHSGDGTAAACVLIWIFLLAIDGTYAMTLFVTTIITLLPIT
jgi:hypothetical protein